MLKGSNTVDQFRSLIGGFYATLRRDSRYRLLLRFERVVEVDAPVQFYFETIQSFETEAA